jgi:hypothetical protein
LAIDPQNPNTIYALSNRVYKSVDAGSTWTDVSFGLAGGTTIVVDRQDPSTLYAGTSGGGVFAITFASQEQ